MKNKYLWILSILAIIIGWSLFQHAHTQKTESQTIANVMVATTTTNLSVQVLASNAKTSQSSVADTNTNGSSLENVVKEIDQRYHQGMISKDKAILETINAENLKSQDFYGKAIDQYGEAIVNAAVNGNLILSDGTYGGFNVEKYATTTDSNGLFEFTSINGASLNILINKTGYKMGDRGEGYRGAAGKKTSPTDRAILTMWKLRGAEPLIYSGINAKIPHDGTPIAFDMATGKTSSGGDFRVILTQNPLEVKNGWEKFDWSVKVEILNGGLMEESDAYPYWAPADGYQPTFEFNESTNAVKWLGGVQKKNFYIRTAQGQYGIMQFSVYPGRSPTGLDVNFTINPSGTQNLEPGFSK
jgi:hypothetical protein